MMMWIIFFFFSSRRRHTRLQGDWSSDVCSSDLEVGKLAAVLPDALRFCFDLAAEETVARGARLEIVETPGRARCRGCGADVALDRPYGRCACGRSDLEWLSGEALRILEMEVA